jgi:hypothetical protein
MSLFYGTPRESDWIVTTRPIKVGLSDYLMGDDAGVKPGTRGVITKTHGWNSLEARLDTGLFGSVTVRVKPHQVRVVRRGGGIDLFEARASRLAWARAGVALALVAPLAWFAVSWFLGGGSDEGFVAAVIDSVIYGAIDLLGYVFASPVQALAYVGLLAIAGRFAFR